MSNKRLTVRIDPVVSKKGKGFLKSLTEITEKLSVFIILLIIAAYFATGIHQINSSEVGLVIHFGKAVRTEQPGINYHLTEAI